MRTMESFYTQTDRQTDRHTEPRMRFELLYLLQTIILDFLKGPKQGSSVHIGWFLLKNTGAGTTAQVLKLLSLEAFWAA